ncbi:tetratricopeptide repeat protein [Lentzea sp. CA-135723]|uniref:tetratricopeptide repeat protein n=1 Tax=Lentzea sp. CA-135723 TaxID=3239950 RepID=UPI003D93B7A9
MTRLRGARWWHGLVSVLTAAGVGVLTNLATGEFSWALVIALAALVLVQAGLAWGQSAHDHRDRVETRDGLLGELRPAVPASPSTDDARAVVHWLTAPYSPTPLWGRSKVHDELRTWCTARDPKAEVARVITGPAGVGKSRLALAVAESLQDDGWAAGRLKDQGTTLIDAITAAGDPTLVVVDDADRVPADVLAALLTGAMAHPDLVRVLLLARTADALKALPDNVLPHVRTVTALRPVGEAADRQRWYAQAVAAYAKHLHLPKPDLPERPVGTDEDTLLVLHARALLAVLGRSGTRTHTLATLVAELVTLEQRTWAAAGHDVEVLAEAVTVLALLPAADLDEAADLLRRVPQFSADAAQESRVAVARWARRRYAAGPDHRLDLRPHLVAERLVLDTLATNPRLLRDDDVPAAAALLARAHITYPDALSHLTGLLARQRSTLPEAIEVILSGGVGDHLLDQALAALISTEDVRHDVPTRGRLLLLEPAEVFLRLRTARSFLAVTHYREMVAIEPGQHRSEMAGALRDLASGLYYLGRYQEALTASEEAVGIRRELVMSEPEQQRPELVQALSVLGSTFHALGLLREAEKALEEGVEIARALVEEDVADCQDKFCEVLLNLAVVLGGLGRNQEALAAADEVVRVRTGQASADPERYREFLAISLDRLGRARWSLGDFRNAREEAEESVKIYRELAAAHPGKHFPEFHHSLFNLGNNEMELHNFDAAAELLSEAVDTGRHLAAVTPGRYRAQLALSLYHLGLSLVESGRLGEARKASEEAVAIRRQLAAVEPARHLPELARDLHGLALVLGRGGDPEAALAAVEEAIPILRALTGSRRRVHLRVVAATLMARGSFLQDLGRDEEALVAVMESVATHRELVEADDLRHNAKLAASLRNLGVVLGGTNDVDGALDAHREAVELWRICTDQDEQLYGPYLRTEIAILRKLLDRAGRHEEAAQFALEAGGSEG